jgi:uncharacterized membrane protein YbhN (UPF0104 family)
VKEQVMLQYGSSETRSAAHKPSDSRNVKKAAVVAAKLIVTGLCFWYLSWQIDLSAVFKALRQLELRWAAASVFVVILQLPLVAARWREILKALVVLGSTMTSITFVAITAMRSPASPSTAPWVLGWSSRLGLLFSCCRPAPPRWAIIATSC